MECGSDGALHKIPIAWLLDGIEPKEKRKARTKERSELGTTIVHGDLITGDKLMNTNSGTNYGIIGEGNTQSITDSFKVISGIHGEELADLFANLNQGLVPLKDEMKGKDYKVLEEHVAALLAEAKKPEPDTNQLSVSGKGLVEAATTVGAIAGPVITTAGLILKFFGVTLP